MSGIYDETPPGLDIANPGGHITLQDKVALPPVFSGHKFLCCLGLGETTSDASRCCSGYALEEEEGAEKKSTCRLPSGRICTSILIGLSATREWGTSSPGEGWWTPILFQRRVNPKTSNRSTTSCRNWEGLLSRGFHSAGSRFWFFSCPTQRWFLRPAQYG